MYGFPDFSKPGAWRNLSVSYNVDDVIAPVLINAADSEFLLSLEMFESFRRHERLVELYVSPDEYHIKWQPVHRYNIYNRNVQWFKFWLKGEIVEAPVDAEQYHRWAKLCRQHVATLKEDSKFKNVEWAGGPPCLRAVRSIDGI